MSNISTLPTSWIICFVVVLNGLWALFCCRSRRRTCRWGWFSIFLTNSRTREFWACFATEWGNQNMRKSMSTSFSIDCSLLGSWLASPPATGCPVLSWSGFGFGWFDRGLLKNLSHWSLINFWTRISHPIMLQGDLRGNPKWRMFLLEYDFSRFHLYGLRDTIGWKYSLKDDCVRSCLIELKSFISSEQFWYRPKTPYCEISSMLCACVVHDAVLLSRPFQDPYGFCPKVGSMRPRPE